MINSFKKVSTGQIQAAILVVVVLGIGMYALWPRQPVPVTTQISTASAASSAVSSSSSAEMPTVLTPNQRQTYQVAMAQSYAQLNEALHFMQLATYAAQNAAQTNDSQMVIAQAIVFMQNIEDAKQRIQAAADAVDAIETVPPEFKTLHNQWGIILSKYKQLPDLLSKILPSLADNEAWAIQEGAELADQMVQLRMYTELANSQIQNQ